MNAGSSCDSRWVQVDALATFFETDPGLHVVDVAPFGQEVCTSSWCCSAVAVATAVHHYMWLRRHLWSNRLPRFPSPTPPKQALYRPLPRSCGWVSLWVCFGAALRVCVQRSPRPFVCGNRC